MLQCIRRYYVAIKTLPSKEAESGCLCSRRGINISRTRHNVTYNVPCRLVLNWQAVDLLTFIHIIYQHNILAIDRYFYHKMVWHWMECRMGGTIPFDLYTTSPDRCCQPYEVLQCCRICCDGYAKAMFTTACCLLVLTSYSFKFTKNQICHRQFF
jgi:hypothetical protein